ncbi:hypothetical protein CP8484711_2080B, partial [Chlamydia psittaci 84-8471/1]
NVLFGVFYKLNVYRTSKLPTKHKKKTRT